MQEKILEVRTGDSPADVVRIGMAKIHLAESRIGEVRHVGNSSIAADLKAVFNEAWADCAKYLAGLQSHDLKVDRKLKLAKAEAILDKYPEFLRTWAAKNPEMKVKDNQDVRDSFVFKDEEFQKWKKVKDHLQAVIALLEAKSQIFERAYWDCKNNLDEQKRLQDAQNLNTGGILEQEVFNPNIPIGASKY